MLIAYWIVAGLLAALYLFAGVVKLVRSKDRLRPMMAWVDTMPLAAVRTIGLLEVLGAVGLILPPLTRIAPLLAVAAAVCLAVLQVFAAITHLRMGDRAVAMNVVLLLVAVAAAVLGAIALR